MEFTITCPVDGEVAVELEDVRSVIIREPEQVDITFTCPACGSEITVAAIVPAFLLAAIEALAEHGAEQEVSATMMPLPESEVPAEQPQRFEMTDAIAEAYCEYFRRQLEQITSVEDALDEIDSKS